MLDLLSKIGFNLNLDVFKINLINERRVIISKAIKF